MQDLAVLFLLSVAASTSRAHIIGQDLITPVIPVWPPVGHRCPPVPCTQCDVHYIYESDGRVETRRVSSHSPTECRGDYEPNIGHIDCCNGDKVVICRSKQHRCTVHQTYPDGSRTITVEHGSQFPSCPPGTHSDRGIVCCSHGEVVEQICTSGPPVMDCCDVIIHKTQDDAHEDTERLTIPVGGYAQCPIGYTATDHGIRSYPETSQGITSYPATSQGSNTYPASSQGINTYTASSQGANSHPGSSKGTSTYPASSKGINTYPAPSKGIVHSKSYTTSQSIQTYSTTSQGVKTPSSTSRGVKTPSSTSQGVTYRPPFNWCEKKAVSQKNRVYCSCAKLELYLFCERCD